MDGKSPRLLDIVESRQLSFLKGYFSHFPQESRDAVQWTMIDMYAPYVLLFYSEALPESYHITLRTFQKFLPQIKNALQQSYSNDLLDCLNNHNKVLKRNAYGFRSFYNFKLHIMIRH